MQHDFHMPISHENNTRKGLVESRTITQGKLLRKQTKYQGMMGHNKKTCWQNWVRGVGGEGAKPHCYYLFKLHKHSDRLIIGKTAGLKVSLKYVGDELSYNKRR